MNAVSYLLLTLRWLLVFMWTPAIAAATVITAAKGSSPLELDPLLLGISLAITTLAGATSLAIRINASLLENPERPLVRPWLFCLAHMLGSWLAGCLGFIMGRAQAWDVWTSLLVVLVASFMGAKFVEMMAEKYLSVIRPKTGDPQ